MLFRLLLLFTLVPLAELTILLWLADWTGMWLTLGLILVTGVVGAALARWQGWHTVWRIRSDLQEGRVPTDSLLDGVMILIAGAVLITPGVLTDILGFLLLIPWFRRFAKRALARRFRSRFHDQHFSSTSGDAPHAEGRGRIIETRVVRTGPGDADGEEEDSP